VSSNIPKPRLRKAFNEGRRSVNDAAAENPYDNPKLRRLWDEGRRQQQAGEVKMPIPPLVHGETRAKRAPQNPPGSKPSSSPALSRRGGSLGGRRDS
jgi:hypothetical protein